MASDKRGNDQAEELKKQMEDTSQLVKQPEQPEQDHQEESASLPPRSEVHTNTNTKKMKWRLRYPMVRLLALIFILLVFLVPGYHIWTDRFKTVEVKETDDKQAKSDNVEIIEMDKDKEEIVIEDEFEFAEEPTEPEQPHQNDVSTDADTVKSDEQQENAETTDTIDIVENTAEQPPAYRTYVVKPGDNLFRISLKFYKDRSGEEIIKKANDISDIRNIEPGMKLIIPTSK